jgi:hypothetical protein
VLIVTKVTTIVTRKLPIVTISAIDDNTDSPC